MHKENGRRGGVGAAATARSKAERMKGEGVWQRPSRWSAEREWKARAGGSGHSVEYRKRIGGERGCQRPSRWSAEGEWEARGSGSEQNGALPRQPWLLACIAVPAAVCRDDQPSQAVCSLRTGGQRDRRRHLDRFHADSACSVWKGQCRQARARWQSVRARAQGIGAGGLIA